MYERMTGGHITKLKCQVRAFVPVLALQKIYSIFQFQRIILQVRLHCIPSCHFPKLIKCFVLVLGFFPNKIQCC